MLDLDCHLPAIVAGDARAFGSWLAGAELPLRADLRRYAAVVDVEAVLQEALLRTWQVAPRFDPDGEPNGLLRLSRRIARNLAIDLARRSRRHDAREVETLLDHAVELGMVAALMPHLPDPFLREKLLACRSRLPKKLSAALGARIDSAGNEPDARLAARLKMRLNTFLKNVSRARENLSACLRRAGIDLDKERV